MNVHAVKTRESSENMSSVSTGIKEITNRVSENDIFSSRITDESYMLSQASAVTSQDSQNVKQKSHELNEIASKLFHTVEKFQLQIDL